jgi:MFS family permease
MRVPTEQQASALPPRNRRKAIRDSVVGFPSRSRRVITEHRQRRKLRDREISNQSRRGLDWTNFFMADVQMSFGTFLAFYLADLNWSKRDVGFALTAGGLAGLAAQIPGGVIADAVRWKRGLAALGIGLIATSALILAFAPSFPLVFVAEVLHGLTGGIVGTAIAAISLGLAGRHGMSSRVGRNFRFAAAGNAVVALAMGALGSYMPLNMVFVAAALLCIPTLIALYQIRPNEIDYARARNAAMREQTLTIQRALDLSKNRNLLLFAGCLMLFHLANASLLPLVGQNLATSKAGLGPLFMAGLIAVPQTIVALLAPWIGYWSELWGRKPLLLIAFATEAVRALLFIAVNDPSTMLIVQLLDGVTGAIITVLTLLVITDLTTGTGRFNLAQGIVGTLTGIAAALSTTIVGLLVSRFGDWSGFVMMATVTCIAMVVLWLLLPEPKPAKYLD